MPESPVITRFAPSPTGELHLGNARTALFNALLSLKHGGRFLLRIEDTDMERSRPELALQLQQDLAWLGLAWQGEVLHQSARAGLYSSLLERLRAKEQVYPCFCTSRELELERATQRAAGRPPRYSGRCRNLPPSARAARLERGDAATLRFAVPVEGCVEFDDLVHGPRQFACADIGDFILRRADGTASFFFSNAVDDADSGVTHVLRGDDHLANTPRQLLVLSALGMPAPRYGHLALLTGDDGVPLSKRLGAASLRVLREQGWLPIALCNLLFRLGHSTPQQALLPMEAMASAFDTTHLQKSPAHLDPSQLNHWQKLAVHVQGIEATRNWLGDRLPRGLPAAKIDQFLAAVQPNLVLPDDVLPWIDIVFGADPEPDAESASAIQSAPRPLFEAAAAAADGNDFARIVAAVKVATNLKGPALFKPLRAALTGRLAGPELGPLLCAMPEGCAQRRLRRFA